MEKMKYKKVEKDGETYTAKTDFLKILKYLMALTAKIRMDIGRLTLKCLPVLLLVISWIS